MRDINIRYFAILLSCIFLFLLSPLRDCFALEPQQEIKITKEAAHVYEVSIPVVHDSIVSATNVRISLPTYLRKGLVNTDENAHCVQDESQGVLVCVGESLPKVLTFRWDTHEVVENRFCETLAGEKQETHRWVSRYTFTSQKSPFWIHNLAVQNMLVESGNLGSTYADLTSPSRYIVLWTFGSLTGQSREQVQFSGSTGEKPLLGSLRSIQKGPIAVSVFNKNDVPTSVSSTALTVCTIADLTAGMFDQPISVVYFGEGEASPQEVVEFPSLRFGYETLESIQDSDTISTDTENSTSSEVPTASPTLTPTPHVVVITSASSDSSSDTKTLDNTSTLIPSAWTPTPQGGSNVLAAQTNAVDRGKEVRKISEQESSLDDEGQILGTQTATEMDSQRNNANGIPWWMGGTCILFVVLIGILIRKKKIKLRHVIAIILLLLVSLLMGLNLYAASEPRVLVKITEPRTYYSRTTVGWVEVITYPPNFYFEGVAPGGRVVLSSTPDGTGNVSLGNGGFLTRTLVQWSSTQNFGMNPPTNQGNCYAAQNLPPQELPTQYFNSQNTTYNVRATFQGFCPGPLWQVSELYLVYFPPEPTATPTFTPTPTPTMVPPFLDLPWDYTSDELTFAEAALNINSYFDHEYPMSHVGKIFDVDEVVTFKRNERDPKAEYTAHDGYDYGLPAKVSYGDDQLAAAAGIATYHNDCGSCGNAIHIDHENGYQTRYYHLDPKDLLTQDPTKQIRVSAGQKIGRVGYTGRIIPASQDGAHVHFMVIYDKNHDGNFWDNIPDGLVDPFGWEGSGADPWEVFQFQYAGQDRTGMASRYLWKYSIPSVSKSIGLSGGEVETDKVKVTVPAFTLPDLTEFFLKLIPRPNAQNNLESVGSAAEITAVDGGGLQVKRFSQPINVSFAYTAEDALYYDPDTLSVYSSPDGAIWAKEQTLINHDMRTATATVDHLTYFALMGEKRDIVSPRTTLNLTGQGKELQFHTDVVVELLSEDPEGGLGVDYTLFKLDNEDWTGFTNAVTVASEGAHMISYFAVDKSGNKEDTQTNTFTIDKTFPEIELEYNLSRRDFVFSTEPAAALLPTTVDTEGNTILAAEDEAGNVRRILHKKSVTEDFTTLEIQGDTSGLYAISNKVSGEEGSVEDLRGRYEYFQSGDTSVRVIPHDGGRVYINVDGTIHEDAANTALHIKTNHGTLKIHD